MRLLFVFGPPAVGKMAVGREVARRSDFRLLHNHATIEPLLEVFAHGSPPFNRLLEEFRIRLVEEAVGAGTDLVLTFVWGLDLPEDLVLTERLVGFYERAGADVRFVELYADLDTRLERSRTELRLAEKPSKRDLEWSDANVREMESWVMNTDPARPTVAESLLVRHHHLRLDTSGSTVEETAERILDWVET